MVNYRSKVLVDDEYESQSSYTIDLDLPTTGKLSTIWLGVKAKTVTTGGESSAFIKYLISSVGVNQGGQSHLNSAPPEVFEADYWAKTHMWPQMGKHLGEDASENIEEIVPIMFGDVVNDPNYYVDLAKLSDPKLSVTYNLASTGPNSGTIWDTDYYPRFTVVADLMSGADLPASKGYHSLRQQLSYTPVDSEKRNYELKGGRPIRNLLYQFDRKSLHYGIYTSLANLAIDGKNGEWVPFDLDDRELHLLHRRTHGLCEASFKFDYVYDGANMDGVVDYREFRPAFDTDKAGCIMTVDGGSGRQMPMRKFEANGVTITDEALTTYCRFNGYYPWSIFNLDIPKMLGMPPIMPSDYAPLYLKIEHVSNAATIGGPCKLHTIEIAPPIV